MIFDTGASRAARSSGWLLLFYFLGACGELPDREGDAAADEDGAMPTDLDGGAGLDGSVIADIDASVIEPDHDSGVVADGGVTSCADEHHRCGGGCCPWVPTIVASETDLANPVWGLDMALDPEGRPAFLYFVRSGFFESNMGLVRADGTMASWRSDARSRAAIAIDAHGVERWLDTPPSSASIEYEPASEPVPGLWGSHADLAIDALGNVHASGGDGPLTYANREDGEWYAHDASSRGSITATAIAVDGGGRPVIAYASTSASGTTDVLVTRMWSWADWSEERVLTIAEPIARIAIAIDSADSPHVAFAGDEGLVHAARIDGEWTSEILDARPRAGLGVGMAIGAADVIHIAYSADETIDAPDRSIYYAYRRAGAWRVEVVAGSGRAHGDVALAVDATGRPHIGYLHRYTETTTQIRHVVWDGPVDRTGGDATDAGMRDGDMRDAGGPDRGSSSGLVINEIDYDQPGTDTAEYVEIVNDSAETRSLDGLALVLVNGATASEYLRVELSGSLLPRQYLAVAAPGVAGVPDTSRVARLSGLIQNGDPDAVVLWSTITHEAIDALSYGGDIVGASIDGIAVDVIDGSPALVRDDGSVGRTLCRLPDRVDTHADASDWAACSTPTPGGPNTR
jgi:hypothetical protein